MVFIRRVGGVGNVNGRACGSSAGVEEAVSPLSKEGIVTSEETSDGSTDRFRQPTKPQGKEDVNLLRDTRLVRGKARQGTHLCQSIKRALNTEYLFGKGQKHVNPLLE